MNGPSRYAPAPTAAAAPMAGAAPPISAAPAAAGRSAACRPSRPPSRLTRPAATTTPRGPSTRSPPATPTPRSGRRDRCASRRAARPRCRASTGLAEGRGLAAGVGRAARGRALLPRAGRLGNARLRLIALLKVDSHKDRAQAELDRIEPVAVRAGRRRGGRRGPRRRRRPPLPRLRRAALQPAASNVILRAWWTGTAILAAWAEVDRDARGAAGRSRRSSRRRPRCAQLIVDIAARGRAELDELYDACAMLGRVIARAAARRPSRRPRSTARRGDRAARTRRGSSRRGRRSSSRSRRPWPRAPARGDQGWEFPSCAVPLGQAAVAIAAGLPSDDDEQNRGVGGTRGEGRRAFGREARRGLGRRAGVRRAARAFALVGVEANETPQMKGR